MESKTKSAERNVRKLHLELGDWVYERMEVSRRLSPPMRVVGLWDGCDCIYLEIDPEQGEPFEVDWKDVEPIPFTAEIQGRLPSGIQCLREYGRWYYIFQRKALPFTYVHELQHLLRLDGNKYEINLLEE